MRSTPTLLLPTFVILLSFTLLACGDDDSGKPCTIGSTDGCNNGLVCEEAADGAPTCYAPVVIEGRVFDSSDGAGIAEATVVALDSNGGARSNVAISGDDGAYSLQVAAPRDAQGHPVAEAVTLRVAAQDYQPFPQAPRTALPIELSSATSVDKELVVQNAATDVALIPLQANARGEGTISGRIDVDSDEDAGGVLVLAVLGDTAVASAISDSSGDFTIFNVPDGSVLVEGYRQGLAVTPETVTVSGGPVEDVVLRASGAGLATVEGSVNIVNAPGGSVTSVILVVASSFVPDTARGEAPAGLRAAGVTGAFSIDGVPPGEYVVLAAFENDYLVRDPDTSIGGTSIVFVTVPSGGGLVTMPESFKVTEALEVRSPGANGMDAITTASPSFVWVDDSSEDGYELRVYDAFGELVWEDVNVPRVTGSETVSHTYAGPALEAGMVYQFRALSWKDDQGAHVYISATEDLRGVFTFAP